MLCIRMCLVLRIRILFKNGFIGCRLRPSFIPISLPSCSPFMRFDITFSAATLAHTQSHAMREAHHIYLLILISRKGIKLWQKTREDKSNKQSNIYLLLLLSCTCIQLHGNAYTHSTHTHTNVVRYTILYENFVMKFIEMGFYRNQFRIYLYL